MTVSHGPQQNNSSPKATSWPWSGWHTQLREQPAGFPVSAVFELLQICLNLPKTFLFNFSQLVALRWWKLTETLHGLPELRDT